VIRHALDRPVSTLIGAITLVVLGTFSLLRLPVSLLPELERPRLAITFPAAGSSRDEVLDRITRPAERRLAALPGVISVRTVTGDGVARVLIESEWQTDADRLRIEAERLLGDLSGTDGMTVELATGDPEPIVEVAVLGGGSAAERGTFARSLLVPELARLEGAGRIEIAGLVPRHAVVEPRPAALAARGLTPADLAARLRPVGASIAAGRARAGSEVRPLLVREDAASLDALRALRIPGPQGESVLGDVARVGVEEVPDGSLLRLNGQDGVLVRVFRAPEANAVALARRVRERVGEIGSRAGSGQRSGLRLEIAEDRSREVVAALGQLGIAALIGVGLGTLALRVMLGRWRPTLALTLVVPASMLSAFAGFQLAGISLDVVSLAGLALAAGMLVDSSIVVLEAIETARASGAARPALAGTQEIALPVIASFLTTAVVFLPLIYLKGLARAFFGVQAFAVVASLAASLLFSLTVTPVLGGGRAGGDSQGRSPGRRAYLALLDRALARPALVVIAGLAVAALAALALGVLPRELVPDAASSRLVVRYRLPEELAPEAARRLGEEVARRAGLAGAGSSGKLAEQLPPEPGSLDDGRREETGRVVLSFPDPASAARARSRLAAAVGRLPDVEAWVEPATSAFVESIESAGRRVEVVATASTPERAAALAARARQRLRDAGLREVHGRRDRPEPALLLAWDAGRLAGLGGTGGTDRSRLEQQVRAGLGDLPLGETGRVRIAGLEPEVLLRPARSADPGLIPVLPASLPSSSSSGVVPLGAVARLTPGVRPPALERLDGRPAVRLAFEGETGATGDPDTLLAGLEQGPDERLSLEGQTLELRRAFSQLRLALGLSLLLVFLCVAALYESLRLPLVVMATVPVALGGALGLLAVTGQTLNLLSFLGLILLAGIVVNNAIVLVHRIGERIARGESPDDAIRGAARERYRPILMTTVTTVSGMLPLALLPGEGVELQRALAIAVIGGLTTSTFASLLLVPVLYRFRMTPRA
jgi:HAE1 family hydrophobic/amphiphilic exporter-1